MIRIPRTTHPQELVQQLAQLAAEQSKRPQLREIGQHVREKAGTDANTAIAVLVSVAHAGMRRPAFDSESQTVNDDVLSVLQHGSDCSGLAIACAALGLASGLSARITWEPGRAQETGLAHVFCEFKVDNEWRPADATDPRIARPASG